MGLILDSSVVIAAARRGDTVGDQDAALSAVGRPNSSTASIERRRVPV
jgi:hypothetical protein